jgi:hypothetical protein
MPPGASTASLPTLFPVPPAVALPDASPTVAQDKIVVAVLKRVSSRRGRRRSQLDPGKLDALRENVAGLVAACVGHCPEAGEPHERDREKPRRAWADLSLLVLPYLERIALGLLRREEINDQALAEDIAINVFAYLGAAQVEPFLQGGDDSSPPRPAVPRRSPLRALLRLHVEHQQAKGLPVTWASLSAYLRVRVRFKVKDVLRDRRACWREPPATLPAPAPPVSFEQCQAAIQAVLARLPQGSVLIGSVERLLEQAARDLSATAGAQRVQDTRLRQFVAELTYTEGLL